MTGPPDSPSMLPLVALVRAKVADSGKSLRNFAEDRGVPYSTVRRYADKRLGPLRQPPRAETLRDLAQALDEPLSVVQRAADRSVDRRYHDEVAPPTASSAPFDLLAAIDAEPRLLPEAKRHLKTQVGLLLRLRALAPDTLHSDAETDEEEAFDAQLVSDIRQQRKTGERRLGGGADRQTSRIRSTEPPKSSGP